MGSKAILIIAGQLAYDPNMQYHERGGESVAVVNLKLAVNRKYRNEDEATWFQVSVWGSQAEAINQFCKKGTSVLIEGRLIPDPDTGNPRIWQSNQTGEYKTSYDVYGLSVTFLANLRGREEQVTTIASDDEFNEFTDSFF